MNRTILFPFAVTLALGATLLGACGGDTAASTPTKSATTATAAPSPTKAATTAPAGGAPTLTNPTVTASGLKYQDEVVGTGTTALAEKKVTVHYTLWLPSGKKIQSSKDAGQPFTFTLGHGDVIKGWDEGVAGMKVGGKRLLYIPTALGYGARSPSPDIPANSDLVFEVELLAVQ
jgi:FKBP-type peptidyl-prolyl cis-trans isomerase